MVEHIPTQDAVLLVDEQLPAAEDPVEEDHIERHGGCEARGPVEAHQLIAHVSQGLDAKTVDRRPREKGDVRTGVQEQQDLRDGPAPSGLRSVTSAAGAGGSKREASYLVIGGRLDDLLGEVTGLLGVSESWARHLRSRACFQIRHDHIDSRVLRERHVAPESDRAVLDNALKRRDTHVTPSAALPRRGSSQALPSPLGFYQGRIRQ